MLVTDVSRLPERAKRELIRGENARAEFAIFAQRKLAEALGALGPTRHIEGIGRKVACIHPELAARIRVKFGVQCLHDPEFLSRLVKENPFLKAPCVPGKLTIRVDGLKKTPNAERRTPNRGNEATATSIRPEDAARSRGGGAAATGAGEFQNGKGHGGAGDPRTPSVCQRGPGLVLSFPRRQCSGHETPAHSGKRGIAEGKR